MLVALVLVPGLVHADPTAAPTLKLLSAGKGPKQPLRLAPKQGTRSTIEVVSKGTKARGAIGKLGRPETLPSTSMVLDAEVTRVEPNGDVRVDVTYRKLDVRVPKGTPPERAREAQSQLQALVGAKGYTVVSNLGTTKQSGHIPPENASPQLKQQLEAYQGIQNQIMCPLPQEAVGIGARWQLTTNVTAPAETGALVVNQTAIFNLVELSGTRGKLAITLRQTGKSTDGQLTTSTTGKGTIEFDLAMSSPVSAQLEMRTEVQLKTSDMRLAQVDTTTMTLTSRPR